MFAITGPAATKVPSQYLCFHDTQLYERKFYRPFCCSSRQVSTHCLQPRGNPRIHWLGSVTFFDDPLQTIRNRQSPLVPILLGDTEGEGSVFASFFPNMSAFYAYQFGQLGGSFRPPNLTALYPGLNDTQVLSAVVRDVWFRWCVLRCRG